jgi:hypothetical protein
MAAQDHDLSFKAYKKMISIMIEALENITKYSDQFQCSDDNSSDYCPCCFINRNGSVIELITQNPVRVQDVDPLKEKIDHVNSRDRDELKDLYKTIITNGEFTPKGGAGLGFIEMAKTAGNKLEYSFKDLSTDYSLYTFRVSFSL